MRAKIAPLFGFILFIAPTIVLGGNDGTMPPNLTGSNISSATHAPPGQLKLFSRSDVPNALPRRKSVVEPAEVRLLVKHSKGYSDIEPLYRPNVHRNYSRSGKGEAVPIYVRINSTKKPNTFSAFPKQSSRRFVTSKEYRITGRIWSRSNQKAAIAMATEVLANTVCQGGTVTQNLSEGPVANSYGRNSSVLASNGMRILPGWVINLRCSKWRKK